MGTRLGLGLGPTFSGAPTLGLSLDFSAGVYIRNGVVYPDFATFLSATGSTFTRGSAGYAMDGSASFLSNVARIAAGYLTYEPAATNLMLQSKMASGWTGTAQATATANGDTAPDGTTTALVLKEDATAAAQHNTAVNQSGTALSAARYVSSVFAKRKAGTRNHWTNFFDQSFGGQALATFDLGSGAVVTASFASGGWTAGVASAVSASRSFFRFANSFVPASGTGFWDILFLASGSSNNYNGDNTSSNDYWGAQLELAAASGYFKDNPSSLIATTTGSATRSADALTLTVPVGLSTLTVTFDDNSTQTINGATGSYLLPTTINRPMVKSLTWGP